MTAAPDTETRVIVDLMLSLKTLIDLCDLAEQADSHWISAASVRRIASGALFNAQESAQPTPADPVSDSELCDADLNGIRCDFWDVLLRAPNEIAGLRAALIEGRIDGSNYGGDCACLIGTIAHLRELLEFDDLGNGLKPHANRPIERWFLVIQLGDTPETNEHSQLAVQWLDEFVGLIVMARSHVMSTETEVPIRVIREMEHYKSIMTRARTLIRQGETIIAQDVLSDAIRLPYPIPASRSDARSTP